MRKKFRIREEKWSDGVRYFIDSRNDDDQVGWWLWEESSLGKIESFSEAQRIMKNLIESEQKKPVLMSVKMYYP